MLARNATNQMPSIHHTTLSHKSWLAFIHLHPTPTTACCRRSITSSTKHDHLLTLVLVDQLPLPQFARSCYSFLPLPHSTHTPLSYMRTLAVTHPFRVYRGGKGRKKKQRGISHVSNFFLPNQHTQPFIHFQTWSLHHCKPWPRNFWLSEERAVSVNNVDSFACVSRPSATFVC